MKKVVPILLLVFIVFACEKEDHLEFAHYDHVDVEESLIQYTLCHYSQGSSTFNKLSLPESGLTNHLDNHSMDRVPDDTVTIGGVLYLLDNECEVCVATSSCGQTLIDEFTVSFATAYSHTTPTLTDGQEYVLVTQGIFTLGSNWYRDNAYIASPPDEGMIWNNHNGRVGWNGDYSYRPDPDVYNNVTHQYFYPFTGDGTSHTFTFSDCCYWDNRGQLNCKLYRVEGCVFTCAE